MSDHHTYDDKELLRRVAKGEEAAFTELFDIYQPRVYTTGLKLTRSEHKAEELVQDVFMKVWIQRETLPMVENFGAYLFTITKFTAIRAFRNALRQKELEAEASEGMATLDTGLEHLLEIKEYEQLLKQAVSNLPTQQENVYRLMKEQGYKREEVAQMLGISPLTVKKNLQVAMRSVRGYMMARTDLGAILLAAWNTVEELVK